MTEGLEGLAELDAIRGLERAAGIDAGEFRAVDVRLTTHLCIAPLVMRAIWARSIDALCPEACVDPERFLQSHTEFVLASLRRAPP